MEKLQDILERELTKLMFGQISLQTAQKRIIKAVKERDDFIIGSIPAIITVERYLSGNPKIINNRRLIIRLKEQRQRAEESR